MNLYLKFIVKLNLTQSQSTIFKCPERVFVCVCAPNDVKTKFITKMSTSIYVVRVSIYHVRIEPMN